MESTKQQSILEVPQVNSSQFEDGKNGTVNQNVNLFRGNVNFEVPLVTFSGKNGLNINIGAQYESNVQSSASSINAQAPTGILGLGWQLGYDSIIAQYNGANDDGSIVYKYVSAGGSNLLYRIDTLWQRGSLSSDLTQDLNQSKPSPQLITALLAQSLIVDATSTITVKIAGSEWYLNDVVNEISLIFKNEDNNINVYDGGLQYAAESYNFSRIRYYKQFEKWAITDKKGITNYFGGGVNADSNGNKTSIGNSIQWDVRWANWQGPSIVTHNKNGERVQQQCPISWNLASVTSKWNDKISYAYQQVTQAVGQDGLPYTKACYLANVTGAFGQVATFHYADKKFVATGNQSPREYADPNKPIPNDLADAYQSKYETMYLDSIDISNRNGKLIHSWKMTYDLLQFASIQGGSPPDFFGNTIKRVLTSISKIMPNGSTFSKENYTYYEAGKINAGALHTRTLPEGAITAYQYSKTQLTPCKRSITISPPNLGQTPRIWFGPDYVVVIWYSQSGVLNIAAYTWIGRWVKWQPKQSQINVFINLDSLNVEIQNDGFAISYGSGNDQDYTIFLFYKDDTILGGWLENVSGPISIHTKAANIKLAVGQNFLVVNNLSKNEVKRYTWDYTSKTWLVDLMYSNPGVVGKYRYFLSAIGNVIIALNYDILSSPSSKKNTLELFYIDELNHWQKGDSIQAPEINIENNDLQDNFTWTPSSWVFIASFVNAKSLSSLDYSIGIYTWSNTSGNAYKFNPVVLKKYRQNLTATGASVVPYIAQITATGMVISGPNLLRYNGIDWLENNNLKLETQVDDQSIYWFANGPDIVLKSENTPSLIIGEAQVFDPNQIKDQWIEQSIQLFKGSPTDPRLSSYYPTGGTNYVTFNKNIYQRGTSTDWKKSLSSPAQPPISSDGVVTSLVNEAPCFFSYLTQQNNQAKNTQLLLINNGTIEKGPTLLQNFFTPIDANGNIASNINGKTPVGSLSFITYAPLNATFDNATSLTLYRYLNGNMADTFNAFPVSTVTIDDGFSQVITNYEFDFKNAAIDPDGVTSKFYSVKVYEGLDTNKVYGWKEVTYNNGIGLVTSLGNPSTPAGFDGLPLSEDIYNAANQKIKSTFNTWKIYRTILASPSTTAQTNIRGSYVLPAGRSITLDGVVNEKIYSYDLSSGEENQVATSRYNADGKLENSYKKNALGYHYFDELWFTNQLTGIAQVQASIRVENEKEVVVSSKATTWKKFDLSTKNQAKNISVMASFENYDWLGGTNFQDFDFASWKNGIAPTVDYATFEGWAIKSITQKRSNNGTPILTIDSDNRAQSILLEENEHKEVAKFLGANLYAQEAAYYGFEAYEMPQTWQIVAPASIVDSNAYTGKRSLSLIKDGLLFNSFKPLNQKNVYVLAWWYSTAPGFVKSNLSGFQIDLFQNDKLVSEAQQIIAFESTNGAWQLGSCRIDLSTQNIETVIQVKAINNSDKEVWIDNIRFLPDVSHFSAHVYNKVHSNSSEEIGMGTNVERYVYDEFKELIAKVGPYENQTTLYEHTFLYQRENNVFNILNPNHKLSLKPLSGGYFEPFKSDVNLSQRWMISNSATNWKVGDGFLTHSNNLISDSIVSVDNELSANFALYFQLSNPIENQPLSFTDQFKISIDSNNYFNYDHTTNAWTISIEGKPQLPLFNNTTVLSSILLISTNETILFFVNNQLILSINPSSPLVGQVKIETGKNAIAFRNLAGLKQPKVDIEFSDGASKLRQKQTLSKANTIIGQIIYDVIARKIVATKNAPLRFGSIGKNQNLLMYSPDFVDEIDFLQNLDVTGMMNGNVALYYDGVNNASNDAHYPYNRNRLEACPTARVVEIGLPGKDYAIINPYGTPDKSRPTVKFTYASNQSVFNDLPLGQYFVQTQTDQMGNDAYQVMDNLNQVLIKSSSNTKSKDLQSFGLDGKTLFHFYPNYFDKNTVNNDKFFMSTKYNHLSNVVQTNHPDQGVRNLISTISGRKRFYQDPEGASNGYFTYIKYDALNRAVEKGIFNGLWNESNLRVFAQDPNWPLDGPDKVVQNKIDYVLHDNNLNGIGKIKTAKTFNTHAISTTEENFVYDDFDQLKSKETVISQNADVIQKSAVLYKKSFTGKLSMLTYPQNILTGMPAIIYTYDHLDRLIAIGEKGSPNKHAFYIYNDAGELSSLQKNNQTDINNYTYYSPAWLKSIADPATIFSFNQTINTRYANGNIKAIDDSFQTMTGKGTLQSNFVFDEYEQLIQAKFTEKPEWDSVIQNYDTNGNTLKSTEGTDSSIHTYLNGTNQLTSIQSINGNNFTGTYYKNGALKAMQNNTKAMSFTYIAGRGLTASIDIANTKENVVLSYDHNGNRSVKTIKLNGQAKSQKIYIHGEEALPLAEVENGNAVAYIYDTNGLIALFKNNEYFYITKDNLGSARLVQDQKGNAKAVFNYKTYGTVEVAGDASILSYLYTGQEYDVETGLYNYRARLYDPMLGRFTSTDPKNQNASPYLYANNDPLDYTDPTGESFFGDLFSWIAQIFIDIVEIVAAVAIDVVTDGAGAAFTGGLLGAGLNGAAYDIGAAVNGTGPGWKGFGEAQATGAIQGAATEGFGELGDAAQEGIETATDSAVSTGGKIANKLAAPVNVGIRATGSALAGVTNKAIDNGFSGRPAGEGLGTAALSGFLSGAVAGSVGKIGNGIVGKGATFGQKLAKGAVVGAVNGASRNLITAGVDNKKVNGLTLTLDSGRLATNGIVKTLRFNPKVSKAFQLIDFDDLDIGEI